MPRSALPTALATCLAAVLGAAPAAADEVLVDGIAAQVGTDIVLLSEVMDKVRSSERELRAAGGTEADLARLRAEGLEAMIETRLLEQVVREMELTATDAEVDETIESIARENGISVEQLRQTVARQNMSYEDYRAEIRRGLERRKVISAMVSGKVHVEDAEVEALYRERFAEQPEGGNQVHLRQLLVPAGQDVGRSLAESCELVTELRERIRAGESFEELARQHSAAAPAQGGDIGWLHEDKLAGWMTRLIEPLQDGGVSEVSQLPFGCTIVKLVERKTYEPVSYEQARTALHNEIYDRKLNEAYREWMEELREETFIERRGYFADAAELGKSSGQSGSPSGGGSVLQ